MSDLVAAAEYNRQRVTPGTAQGNEGSFATPSGVTGGGRNSVSPHPQVATPPPNLNRPLLKINIPSRGPTTGQMASIGVVLEFACLFVRSYYTTVVDVASSVKDGAYFFSVHTICASHKPI